MKMNYSLEKFLENAKDVADLRESKESYSPEEYIVKLKEAVHYLILREGAVQRLYAEHDAEIEYIDSQIKKMQEYKRLLQTGQEAMVQTIKDTYKELNLLPRGTKYQPITVRKTPGRVIIDDEDAIPFKYKKEVTTISIDKQLINTDISAGIHVPGAHIEKDISIRGLR
jgi:hypothetical protein